MLKSTVTKHEITFCWPENILLNRFYRKPLICLNLLSGNSNECVLKKTQNVMFICLIYFEMQTYKKGQPGYPQILLVCLRLLQ